MVLDVAERHRIFALTALRSATSVLDLIAIALLALAVTVATGGPLPDSFDHLFSYEPSSFATVLLISSAGLFLSKSFLGLALSRVSTKYLAQLETSHSNKIARILLNENHSLRKKSPSEAEWAILRATEMYIGLIGQAMIFVAEFTLAIAILTIFFVSDPLSASFVVLYILAFILVFQVSTRNRFRQAGGDVSLGSVGFSSNLRDILLNFREMKVTGALEEFLVRMGMARQRVALGKASDQFLSSIPRYLVETGLIVGALTFGLIEFTRFEDMSDFADIAVLTAGSLRLLSAILPIQRSVSSIIYLREPAEMALEALENEKKSRPPGITVDVASEVGDVPRAPMEVRLDQVSFRYPDETHDVLRGVSLVLKPNTVTALVGPSGAGKSTLADLLMGLVVPTSGEVLANGVKTSIVRKVLPGLFGYVPQKPGLVHGSILENIALGVGADDVDSDQVWKCIFEAGLFKFVDSLPFGIDEDLGKQLDNFSGGQLQRIGIARALYTNPKFMVFDEATSALDPETEASLSETFVKLRSHATVVVIAHRLSTVKNADSVVILQDGKVVGHDSFSNLKSQNQLMKKFVAYSSLD